MANDPIANPFRIGHHLVTGIWQYMLPAELAEFIIPDERQATCMNCPRVVTDQYRPDYRCCTYLPRIPNFLIGLALNHEAAAQAGIHALIASGQMTPEGLIPSPRQWSGYIVDVAEERFGKTTATLCPLLNQENGYCGVYAFRNAVCSTFFCHHDHASRGEKFWSALQNVASQCELALGQWVMDELGMDVAAYTERLNSLDPQKASLAGRGGWTKAAQRKLWGAWFGREAEFFKACGTLVARHRERLWEIANSIEIAEAQRFERRSLQCIPKAHRDEAEAEQQEQEGGESETPARLWEFVQGAYHKLWAIPASRLQLNPRTLLQSNPGQDAEERHHHERSHIVALARRQGSQAVQWREFVDASTLKALARFATPLQLTTPLLNELAQVVGREPLHFIAEWQAKRILVPVSGMGTKNPQP